MVSGPYDPFPFLTALVGGLASTPEGQAVLATLLHRMIVSAGITQEDLEAAAAALQPPKPPA